ncbi:FecR family protein [Variovorax sp. LT1R16]|uniref:FecR family protein n=1 Tax=Variovorax sp. LT1R16 TaxID=3443728 RepID=UPI003F453810
MKTPVDDRTSADELERQAWVWLRRLSSGDVKTMDAEAFKRWLRTSPTHKSVFSAAKKEWALIKPAAGGVLRTNVEAASLHEQALHGLHHGRRAFLGAAIGASAVAGVAVLHPPLSLWPSPNEWGADDRTATGEQRTLAVSQRVQVTLNTQTSVRRQTVDGETTGIDLLTGEAAVDLFGPGMSFTVIAGVGRSLAESGRFEVRHLDGKVCVTCIEGTVRVAHPSGVRSLQARQRAIYDAASVSSVTRIEPADTSAWRKGELVFQQTPLAQVVEEINRYRPGRVLLMNTAARSKPVSGSFAIGLLDVALAQLQRTFDLRARSLPAGLYVLS